MNPKLHLPNEMIARFCRTHAVRELALFGSAVRDDFRDDSDIDVLIDFKNEARVGLVAIQQMRDELAAILGRTVDLITRNGLNRHIRDEVLNQAEVIYADPTLEQRLAWFDPIRHGGEVMANGIETASRNCSTGLEPYSRKEVRTR